MQARTLLDAANRTKLLVRTLSGASLVAYAASLFLPAFSVLTVQPEAATGYIALLLGSYTVALVGSNESIFLCFAWFANLAFAAAHINLLQRHGSRAIAFSATGLVLSASFALVRETTMRGMCTPHPIALHVGYFLWASSMGLALGSSVATVLRADSQEQMRSKRAAVCMVLISAAYVALGLLLPKGECALLR
jgi:hypothetical protein